MEGDVMEDYWNECRLMPSLPQEEESGFKSCEEGELEVEWLEDVGLEQVTAAFHQGEQVSATELDTIVQHFSPGQAEAVRRRVRTLNNTVRQRKSRHRPRKADVRDLFKDVETQRPSQSSNDSMDSGQFTTTIHLGDESLHQRRKNVARFPSVPLSASHPFRNYNPDVAGSDGLRLISFHYLGTLPRHRSGSDPFILDESAADSSDSSSSLISTSRLSRSHGSLLEVTQPFRSSCSVSETDRTWIDSLDPSDVEQLKPLLVAEATTIMDDYCTLPYKKKPLRMSKKPEGNVFGVPIVTLLDKDARFCKGEVGNLPVPAVLHMLVNHLEMNHIREEGLLRVAGLKTRIDSLVSTIESNFYPNKQSVEQLLFSVTPHDITAVLKKLLRELPEPLLTYKLILKFYSTHAMLNREVQKYVLNLLTLQLPREHQAALRFLFKFVHKMLEAEAYNKMGIHSVATILAPSIFPPRSIALTKEDIKSQVQLAERCIKLTELLLSEGESLWLVPRKLINQLRNRNQKENSKPSIFRNSKTKDVNAENILRTMLVEAPQFHLPQFQIPVSESLTAKEVVLKVIKEGISKCEGDLNDPIKLLPRGRMKPMTELTGVALSCVLSGAEPETALQTHFLFEYGGNIVQRELEHGALVTDVLRDNPAARWKLECRHRNCPKR